MHLPGRYKVFRPLGLALGLQLDIQLDFAVQRN